MTVARLQNGVRIVLLFNTSGKYAQKILKNCILDFFLKRDKIVYIRLELRSYFIEMSPFFGISQVSINLLCSDWI